jgi:hypothetical protein
VRHRPNQPSSQLATTGLLAKCLAVAVIGVCAARADQWAFTLTYEGLGVANGASVPEPYPGIPAAVVTHAAISNGVPVPDVYFWGDVSPLNGYGNLTNVAVGPNGVNVFAGVIINPNSPSNHVRLISLDFATKDDGLGDLSFPIYVQDTENTILRSPFVEVVGDANNATHTLVDFGGIPVAGPVNRGLAIYWPASNGRVAVDNVQFEIVGPTPPVVGDDFHVVGQGGNLHVPAPGVLSNDSLGGRSGTLKAGLVNATDLGTLNLVSNQSSPSFRFVNNSAAVIGNLVPAKQSGFISELDWRPTIGDPTFMGWFTVAAYAVAGGLAAFAALAGGRTGGIDHNSPGQRRRMWLAVAGLMMCLCINKQLDLQSLLTEIGRVLSRHEGWYEQRRDFQIWFVLGVIVGAVVFGCWFVWRFHEFWRRHKLLTTGLTFLLTFIVVRAISFHHVEVLFDSRVLGFKMNWVLELWGIFLISFAAIRDRAGRPTSR